MPILKHGNKETRIPFSPRVIARLLFQGYDVVPDSDLAPEEANAQQLMIANELQSLWGGENFKTDPARQSFRGVPSIREDAPYKEGIKLKSADYLNVTPRPYTDPGMQTDIQQGPPSWEALLLDKLKGWFRPLG